MGNRKVIARVVVVAHDDAGTIVDCLDGIADQGVDVEVVVVDQDSGDGTADIAIHHPLPDRVVVVPGGSLQRVVDAAARDATRLLIVPADSRPAPGWIAAGLAGLEQAPLVLGPDRRCRNLALDVTSLAPVHLFPADEDVDEVVRRARLAGECSVVVDGLSLCPAAPAPAPPATLPETRPPSPGRPRFEGRVTVVLCTRDRPHQLERCLQSLRRLDDDDHDIVVVDNHAVPTVDPAALPPRARLLHEPRPGLDIARNRGAAATDAEIVAYIDDDCEADPHWVSALRVAFADPGVGFVTGRVRPASLAEPTHRHFEAHFTFDRGLARRRFTPWDDRPWFPLWAGALGTGCNMAFRRRVLVDAGGFDELLDVGTTIGGGGDLDMFARLLDRGVAAEYSPRALVWHHHRDTAAELRRQFLGYGVAVGAYLAKAALERRGLRFAAVRFYGERVASRLRVARNIRAGVSLVPMELLVISLVGQAVGPFRYLRARSKARRRR